MDYCSFLLFASVMFIAPSASNTMVMHNVRTWGLKDAFACHMGIWLGVTTVALLCAAVGNIVHEFFRVEQGVRILSSLIMLFLAWRIYVSSVAEYSSDELKDFTAGMMLQLTNIKLYLFAFAAMEMYVIPHFQGLTLKLFPIALLLGFVGFVFSLLWAVAGPCLNVLFTKHVKASTGLVATAMLYFAVSIFA